MAANIPCRSASAYGAVGFALVADSTITTPKMVSSTAVDAIITNSVEGGANSLPSETRADSPLPAEPALSALSVRGG
ncbi:hypothetical protein MIAR_02030 [Microbacterium arabinogalactanolyticum]|uniref:Uncharacterized protein n=1 Tax=Microbacterium arabinogalactanolyticum TaxID=69365 RepID=A0ABQ5NCU2_9MICO|nr:hypothetical protein MIAR_02030 [Microbacterium arabinogalactanolyticum]